MSDIFGDYIENLPPSEEYLTLGFSPSSIPLKQRWRNNGLSADFLADYLTTFFPKDESDPSTVDRHSEIKSAVSYIANELLENAMKFSSDAIYKPISIRLQLEADYIIFIANNSSTAIQTQKLQIFIKQLINSDPSEFYIEQLEKGAMEDNQDSSGLGYITMINDYFASLGWKIESSPDSENIFDITTMVKLNI